MIDELRSHYDARRPGWQLLDAAGRVRERARYVRTAGRDERSAQVRRFDTTPLALQAHQDPRPRVLVCDRYVPAADRDAGSARMAWLLRLLAPLCSHVTFVPVRRFAFAEYAEPLRQAGIEVVVGDGRALERLLKARTGMYDVAVLSRAEVASRCVAAVRRQQPGARVIFDTVELTSTRLQRQCGIGGGSLQRVARERRLEDRAVRLSDVVAAVSEAECREIGRRRYGVRTVVLPLVYSARVMPPGPSARRDLLFVGNFTHPPNADAVGWFSRAVLPRIRDEVDVTLRVIGPGATARMVAGWGPHVTYAGWVRDLQPHVDSARIAVAPLRYGAGVKGKVGESLAMGLPCVATSVAAEGMDVVHGTHLLVADEPSAFAAAVVRTYTDAGLWKTLSDGGVAFAAANWSSSAMTARLSALLCDRAVAPRAAATSALLSRSAPTLYECIT